MKSTGWMGLAAALLLSGCAMFSDDQVVAPVAAPEPTASAGDWLLVSCHLDNRGCRDEDRYDSEAGCKRAVRQYQLDNRERRAACRLVGD